MTTASSRLRFAAWLLSVLGPALLAACASGRGRPLVWKIEKDGHSSTLVAIMHAGAGADDVPVAAWKALRESAALVAEIDPRPPRSQRREDFESMFRIPSDQPGLDRLLTPAAWAELRTRVPVPEDLLARSTPMVAAALLERAEASAAGAKSGGIQAPSSAPSAAAAPKTPVAAQKAPNAQPETPPSVVGPAPSAPAGQSQRGMQEALVVEARSRDLPVSFLEEKTMEYRRCAELAVLRALEEKLASKPPSTSPSDKSPSAKGADEDASMARIVALYREGDVRALKDVEEAVERESGAAGSCTVQARNRVWAEKIEKLHEAYAPALFAVGVGHVVTKDQPLLDLLERRGFTVERSSK